MMPARSLLIAALALPIIALCALAGYHGYGYYNGKEFTLPIEGYDPRDLLSGHYLIYRIDYGPYSPCDRQLKPTDPGSDADQSATPGTGRKVYACLETKEFRLVKPVDCPFYVEGECDGGRFRAGLERFYVPESRAKELEAKIQNQEAAIVLSALPHGRVQVKELLIGGESWRQAVEPAAPPSSDGSK